MVIAVRDLAKRFGEVRAVDGVTFSVARGELFGFLGPNGAGKTTTMNMLIGLARPGSGSIEIGGIDCTRDPKPVQHLMGIVPDESNLYPELTGFGNLCFCGALYGMGRRDREARARELLALFGLAEAGERKLGGYSKGMKRRLTIAAGIIHAPPILFLDEPTTGIDVASARQIRQLIADLSAQGTTVFLTTHYIEEAERLCRRIAFIVRGRIVRIDTVANLLDRVRDRYIMEFALSAPGAGLCEAVTARFPHLRCYAAAGNRIRVESAEPVRVGPVLRLVEESGGEVLEARRITPSLEEVFVEITGIESEAMRHEKERNGRGGGE
ncbi:MAG: ABC transporter ATP-binding protein [Acidimicrobiia bacterium]|nr:ABC transporter ATP-binding protein [Acidimicrobiia bacterium]